MMFIIILLFSFYFMCLQIISQASEICPYLRMDSYRILIEKSNSGTHQDETTTHFYVEFLNVLTACASGKSHTSEAQCQMLIPLQVILEFICETQHLELLSGFVRFLYISILWIC
jgi:hypothetical protein